MKVKRIHLMRGIVSHGSYTAVIYTADNREERIREHWSEKELSLLTHAVRQMVKDGNGGVTPTSTGWVWHSYGTFGGLDPAAPPLRMSCS